MCDVGTWGFRERDYVRERGEVGVKLEKTDEHPLKVVKKKAVVVRQKSVVNPVQKKKKDEEKAATKKSTTTVVKKTQEMDDPLSGLLLAEDTQQRQKADDDPLLSGGSSSMNKQGDQKKEETALVVEDHHQEKKASSGGIKAHWNVQKQAILRDYGGEGARTAQQLSFELTSGARALPGETTQQKRELRLSRGFSTWTDAEDDESKLVKSTKAPKMVERSAARLEHLETSSMKQDTLSTAEYAATVERIFQQMQRAWVKDERVNALKLAIQTAKLLAKSPDPHYPALFVLCTDVLDLFASYVYQRIEMKKKDTGEADAKETCRNWFYKTACVRDLVPRFYVEVALLKCYSFLSQDDLPKIAQRLGHVARGFGDPTVAAYARAYLARVGRDAIAWHASGGSDGFSSETSLVGGGTHHGAATGTTREEGYASTMLSDSLFGFGALTKRHAVTSAQPAFKWLLTCVGAEGDERDLDVTLAQYRDYCNDAGVLKGIVEAFDSRLVAKRAAAFATLAKRAEPSTRCSTVELLSALGASLAKTPPVRQQRLAVLNEVWKLVARCTDLAEYVDCAANWLDCLLRHYTDREVKVLLGDVIKRVEAAVRNGELSMAAGSSSSSSQQQQSTQADNDSESSSTRDGTSSRAAQRLEDLVQMLVSDASSEKERGGLKTHPNHKETVSSVVLASDYVLKLLDLFRPHRKVEIAKELLAGAARQKKFADPVLVHTVLEMARVAHDALDSLSPEGERAHIAGLVVKFVDRIDMGRDLERQLAVYVECRAAFPNLDPVLDRLVLLVARLAVAARKATSRSASRGQTAATASTTASHGSSKKGAASQRAMNFSKACLAFCHVTVPSITKPFRRFELLVLLGHVSLLQTCLPQADTFFKMAVALIPDLPADADAVDADSVLIEANTSFGMDPLSQRTGEAYLSKLVASLASSLIAVPGPPDKGPLYLVRGLLNALPRYKHWRPSSGHRASAYLAVIPVLAAYHQRRLPYSVPGVESNDVLYGGSTELGSELLAHLRDIIDRLVQELADIGKDPDHDPDVRALRVLDLVNVLVAHVDLDKPDSDAKPFATKLIGLVVHKIPIKLAPTKAYLELSKLALVSSR